MIIFYYQYYIPRATCTSSSNFAREHILQRKLSVEEHIREGSYLEEGDSSGLYEERSSLARALAHAL
jgi:hypothetical protein